MRAKWTVNRMADILIKGLCLPKDWEMLSINIGRDGKVSRTFDLKNEQIAEAIIVPPHGRLIDADELYKLIDGGYDLDFDEDPETKHGLLRMINERETVLEASEEEKE